MSTTTYTPPPCMVCGEATPIEVSTVALEQWQGGAFIQDAFGDLPAEVREQIKTGTHPACWDAMFGGFEDD